MNVKLQYPVFPDLIQPKGRLPRDIGAQACWYFFVLADKAMRLAGDSIDSQIITVDAHDEGAVHWMNKPFEQLAHSVAVLYGLESPDVFQAFWHPVIEQALLLGIEPPNEAYTGRVRLKNISV